MLKVMIVDDEIIVRVGIQSCIHWEEYGCQVTATCESGAEALAMCQKEIPDIVFTDIMMPEMNGIELVENIRAAYPATRIVVLSCVNEIEYVKKAIRLGAEDYILKLSFTKDMLAEILIRLKADIEEERRKNGEEDIYTSIRALNREEAFRTLLSDKLNLTQQEQLLDQLGYPYNPFETYQTACLLIERSSTGHPADPADTDMMRYGLLNIIREYFAGGPEFELVFMAGQEIMVIFRLPDQMPAPNDYDERLKRLNQAVKTHLNITLSMGLEPARISRTELRNAYQKARNLAELNFFSGSGSYHDHEDADIEDMRIRRCNQKVIQEAVFLNDQQKVNEVINDCFETLAQYHNHRQIPVIRRTVVETWIYLTGNTITGQEPAALDQELYPLARFWEAENLAILKDCFKQAVELLMNDLAGHKAIDPGIARFLLYLANHVADNITLEQAAARCSLGKSQFCILFKKATGETFINYFNRLKMETAYTMLGSGNVQVQEAAARIGIRDISYFSRLFKKFYQISPSEVRKST